MKIADINLSYGLALAPMAGVTDRAFREMCKEFGAEYMVSEMISAKGLHYNDKKTEILADFSPSERPIALQLFGREPEIVAEAVQTLSDRYAPNAIDINMGCPMPKIVNNGEGSALMKDLPQAGAVLRAAVKAAGKMPITVKFRTGWDKNHINAPELAKIAEDSGVSAICIHGRTREQLYRPGVDYDTIFRVKQAVSVPVFGNGDVTDATSAARLWETGVDGIMVGRGAQGNPFLFSQLRQACRGEEVTAPTVSEQISIALRHIELSVKYKGEHTGILESRKHLGWYLCGIPGASRLRLLINEATTLEQMKSVLASVTEADQP